MGPKKVSCAGGEATMNFLRQAPGGDEEGLCQGKQQSGLSSYTNELSTSYDIDSAINDRSSNQGLATSYCLSYRV